MSNKAKDILAKIAAMFSADDAAQKFSDYKLTDGSTISCDKLEVGGVVTKDGQPAPAGEYELEDKSKITVDANGIITAITPAAAAATPDDMSTPEGMKKMFSAFEERLKALETLLQKQATSAQLAEQAALATNETITKQAAMMKEMFALMNEIVGAPQADPPEQKKKFSFGNIEAKKKSIEKFKAAAVKLNEQYKESLKTA